MKKIKILDFAILILVLIAITIVIIIGLRIKENKETVGKMTEVVTIVENLQQNLQTENAEDAKNQL